MGSVNSENSDVRDARLAEARLGKRRVAAPSGIIPEEIAVRLPSYVVRVHNWRIFVPDEEPTSSLLPRRAESVLASSDSTHLCPTERANPIGYHRSTDNRELDPEFKKLEEEQKRWILLNVWQCKERARKLARIPEIWYGAGWESGFFFQ